MYGATNEPAIRNAVWDMTDGHCARCRVRLSPSTGRTTSMHVDHVRPASLGGIDHLSNYQPLCRTCNTSKGNSNSIDYRDPAVVPASPAPRPLAPNSTATTKGLGWAAVIGIAACALVVAGLFALARSAPPAEPNRTPGITDVQQDAFQTECTTNGGKARWNTHVDGLKRRDRPVTIIASMGDARHDLVCYTQP